MGLGKIAAEERYKKQGDKPEPKRPLRIYLATPYSDQSHYLQINRFISVTLLAASLMRDGHFVFSPITHTHPITEMGQLPGDWEFWREYDRTFIEWADELWIFKLDGWDRSVGVRAETRIAEELGKPIKYIDPGNTLSRKEVGI